MPEQRGHHHRTITWLAVRSEASVMKLGHPEVLFQNVWPPVVLRRALLDYALVYSKQALRADVRMVAESKVVHKPTAVLILLQQFPRRGFIPPSGWPSISP